MSNFFSKNIPVPGVLNTAANNGNSQRCLAVPVVIAIIAILAAMLLPALSAARERGRTAACLSNLKSIGYYFPMYTGDNNGYFPHPLKHNNVGTRDQTWVDAILLLYMQPDLKLNSKKLIEGSFLESSQFRCPSFSAAIPGTSSVHYGYNYWHLGAHRYTYLKKDKSCWPSGTHNRTANVSALDNPSGTVAVGDSIRRDTKGGTYWVDSEYKATGHNIDPRHGAERDYNIAWADGHATTQLGDGNPINIYEPGQLGNYVDDPNCWTTSGRIYAQDR